MKKKFLLTLLALLGMTQTVAQEYEYVPFVREGVKWVYYYVNNEATWHGPDPNLALGTNFFILEIKGDTIIDGKSYKAMHKYSGNAIDPDNDTIPIYLREEDKVVYGIVPDSIFYHDCPIGYGPEYLIPEGLYGQIWSGQEFVLYDFADTKKYYESENMFDPDIFNEFQFSYIACDTIKVGDIPVKRHKISRWNCDDYIIESVGFDGFNSGFTLHYFYSMYWSDPFFHLSHIIEDGEIIFKGMRYREDAFDDIDEVAEGETIKADDNYYDLMGRAVGKEVPTTPGIYIHQGKKIIIR